MEPMTEERDSQQPIARYYDVDFAWVSVTPLRAALRGLYPYGCKVVAGLDWIGGKVARGLGLTQSRFQYAVDEHNRRERRRLQRERQEAELMLRRARERGLLADDDDVPYAPRIVTRIASAPTADLQQSLLPP